MSNVSTVGPEDTVETLPEGSAHRRAVVVVDDGGIVRSWDAGAESMFGFPASTAVGRDVAELIVPSWLRDAHGQGFHRYVRSHHELVRTSPRVVVAARADGTTTPVEIDLVPVEVDGRHRTVALMRDVSGQPARETPMPSLLEALFARAPEIITLVDGQSRQFSVNDAAARILGYDSVIQRMDAGHSFIHPDDRERMVDERRRIVAGELPPETGVRFRVRHADGSWRWLEAVIADLSDVPGVEARVMFSRDVTEAEQHRTELAEARADAETQAERLREHDRARNDFVLSVSHELRTPLTSLISGAELLLDGNGPPLDDATRDTVEILQRNANRLRRLIENLLLVSRLQTGMEDLVPTEIDVRRLVDTALDVVRPKAEERGVRVQAEVAPGPAVVGDRQQLAAVLDNVVGNAVKYTDPGTDVRIEARPTDGGWTIDVHDTGPGVAPGEEERIFERFARGSAATGQNVPGTGLGLAISRTIMELHGGSLTVVSGNEVGATFRVVLPADASRARAEDR